MWPEIPVHPVTVDGGPAGHLVGVGATPLIHRVAAPEKGGVAGVIVADRIGQPTRHLVGQVPLTLIV